MAIKTVYGWRNKRRPETEEAVKKFEVKTGLKVLSAQCRPHGSMRPYVNFLVNGERATQFADNYYPMSEEGKILNGVKISFMSRSSRGLHIDVTWEDLGMVAPF